MRGREARQEIEITVDSIGFEGVAVGRLNDLVHFVKGALPGEHVRAQVTRRKKSFVEAEVLEVLSPSPDRQEAPCPHFGVCGGCKWQHLEYSQQAQWKRQHVADAFTRIAKVDHGVLHNTLSPADPYHYRNKMEFSFGASRWLTREEIDSGESFETRFALGLHVPGRFDKVRHIDACLLQGAEADNVLKHTHQCAEQHGIVAYHQRAHTGFARHLVIRRSATTGSVMTILITTSGSAENEVKFVEDWLSLQPSLPAGSSMIHAVNDTWSPVAIGQIVETRGPGYLTETSLGVEYRISPFSFFQTNTVHLPTLVERAMVGAGITNESTVWDLYCGTGTLTLPAARLAKHVVGAELSSGSIEDARANAERNNIGNVEFHVVDLHVPAALNMLAQFPTPDVVMIDPPRNGMHPQVVEHLLSVGAPRIMYVSCNPATMARDCAILDQKYRVEEITPVDMFPQTFHVEAVAVLTLR